MNFIERLAFVFGYEKRAGGNGGYFESYVAARGSYLAGGTSPEGVISALGVATACIARRSQGLASVPLCVHRNLGPSNVEQADNHPLYDVLNTCPNDYQSAYELREFLIRSHDLHGNAYARVERDNRGQVIALHPFAPTTVSIEVLANGRRRYRATDFSGKAWTLLQEEMLHVRGPSRDGIYGLSPLQIADGAVGVAVAANDFARSYFDNGSNPDGYITFPSGASKDAPDEIRKHWMAKHGANNRFAGPAVFTNGGEFKEIRINAADAQLLDTRKYSAEDIARIFDCPPTSVGIVDRSTYANTEQEALALVRNCLAPLAARFESAFARCLLTTAGRRSYFFRHDFAELLRGDMKTRYESYRLAREIGVFSPNDIRRRENEPPIEGGDVYHVPVNWAPLGAAPLGHNGGPPLGDGATGANG
ncbi:MULTISPECIES: phage portal protein [Methylosinus]|nr:MULTISPECIES: phage portal protein [Methylosinus]OBS51177.1 phage portal protein [Methylosinus sp. 3S-1]